MCLCRRTPLEVAGRGLYLCVPRVIRRCVCAELSALCVWRAGCCELVSGVLWRAAPRAGRVCLCATQRHGSDFQQAQRGL